MNPKSTLKGVCHLFWQWLCCWRLQPAAMQAGADRRQQSRRHYGSTGRRRDPKCGKGTVTIQCLIPETVQPSGIISQTAPFSRKSGTRRGVTLEIVDADENKYNVIIASGDMPDMIRAKPALFQQLIEGGNVIALDDLLKTNGTEITKSIQRQSNSAKNSGVTNGQALFHSGPGRSRRNGA
jgi:hypothetical protein